MIIAADLDGVARAPPVHRRIAVSGLGHGADIDQSGTVGLPGGLDHLDDVARAADVHLHRQFGEPIGEGRDHPADVQNLVHPGDAAAHVFRAGQIAHQPLDRGIALEPLYDRMRLLVRPDEGTDPKPVCPPRQLGQRGASHGAGGSGQENGLLRGYRHLRVLLGPKLNLYVR